MHHDRYLKLVVGILSDVRARHGLVAALELAQVMTVVGSSIVARELGPAAAVRLVDDVATILPPMRGLR